MPDCIVIASASGFIGEHLRRAFTADGTEIVTVGRPGAEVVWVDSGRFASAGDRASLVINRRRLPFRAS